MACAYVARCAALGVPGAAMLWSIVAILVVNVSHCADGELSPSNLEYIKGVYMDDGGEAFNFTAGCDELFSEDHRAGSRHHIVLKRVGLSASLTNHPNPTEIRGMIVGLVLWRRIVQMDLDTKYSINICVEDDEANLTKSAEIYRRFTNRTVNKFDFLLGPSDSRFKSTIAEIARESQTPIIFWSLDHTFYDLPWQPQLFSDFLRGNAVAPKHRMPPKSESPSNFVGEQVATARGWRRRLEQSVKNGSPDHVARSEATELSSRTDSAAAVSEDSAPSRRASDATKPWVYDITLPVQNHMRAPFSFLKSQGSTAVLILDVEPSSNCGNDTFQAAQAEGFTQIESVVFENSPLMVPATAFDLHMSGKPVVLVMCGDLPNVFTMIASMRSVHFMPQALVIAKPGLLKRLDTMLPSYINTFILEPRPYGYGLPQSQQNTIIKGQCQTSTLTFQELDDYFKQNSYFLGAKPTGMTVQIFAAATILAAMFCDPYRPELQTEAELNLLISLLSTFVGPLGFDDTGACSTCMGGLTQLLPLQNRVIEDGHTIVADSRIVIPNNTAFPGPAFLPAYAYLVTPAPDWRSKSVDVYPCPEGCELVQEGAKESCMPCQKGFYRSADYLTCRPCPENLYADEEGLSACKACPAGARCNFSNNTLSPVSLPAYYRFTKPREDLNSSRICAMGYEPPERQLFIHCLAPTRCQGNNVCVKNSAGYVCAQCIKDYTFNGGRPNARNCNICPSNDILALRLCLAFVIYFALLVLLSHAHYRAALDSSDLKVPILLGLLRHMQVLGIVCWMDKIDLYAPPEIQPYSIPYLIGLFFTQPMHVMQLDCLFRNASGMAVIQSMLELTFLFVLSGYVLIILKYFMTLACRVAWFSFKTRNITNMTQMENSSLHALWGELQLKAERRLTDFVRQSIVWTLLTYPVLLVNCAMIINCTAHQMDKGRLYQDLDIPCYEGDHNSYAMKIFPAFIIILVIVPAVFGFDWFRVFTSLSHRTFRVRYSTGILHTGYVVQHSWFELIFIMRTCLLSLVFCIEKSEIRTLVAFIIQFVVIVIYYSTRPRADYDRYSLRILDRMSYFVLLITHILMAVYLHSDSDTAFLDNEAVHFLRKHEKGIPIVIAIIQYVFIVNSIFSIFYNRMLVPLHIHMKTGGELTRIQRGLLRCFAFVYHFHSVRVLSGDQNLFQLDLGRLSGRERDFLLTIVQETLQVCMDSVNYLEVSMLIKALHEIFDRAGQKRNIAIHWAETRASNSFHNPRSSVSSSVGVKSTMITISATSHSSHGRTFSSGSSTNSSDFVRSTRNFDIKIHGLTVDELYAAMQHVASDIISHEPTWVQLFAEEEEYEKQRKPPKDVFDPENFYTRTPEINGALLALQAASPRNRDSHDKLARQILGNVYSRAVYHAFLSIGTLRTSECYCSWRQLQELLQDEECCSQLEALDIHPDDAQKAFVSLVGAKMLMASRGRTEVEMVCAKFTDFLQAVIDQSQHRRDLMTSFRKVEQRGRAGREWQKAVESINQVPRDSSAKEQKKSLEDRCEAALVEVNKLRLELARRTRKNIRDEQVKQHVVKMNEGSELQRLIGRDQPQIATDGNALLTKWAQDDDLLADMPKPSSLLSPRSRGIDIKELDASSLPKRDVQPTGAPQEMPLQLSDFRAKKVLETERWKAASLEPQNETAADARAVRGGVAGVAAAIMARAGVVAALHAQKGRAAVPPPGANAAAQASTTSFPHGALALAAPEPQDALEMCFEVPQTRVQLEVFKAMLLSQLRGNGVPQDKLVSLAVSIRQGTGERLLVDLSGPSSSIKEIRTRDLTQLKVMGYPLRYLQEGTPPVAKPVFASGRTQAPPAAAPPPTTILQTAVLAGMGASGEQYGSAASGRRECILAFSKLRIVEAHRHLQNVQAGGLDVASTIGAPVAEQVNRVGARYKESLKHLEIESDWGKDELADLNIRYGCKVADEMLHTISIAEFAGCDAVRAFAALQELDVSSALLGPMLGEIESATSLDQLTGNSSEHRVGDGVWRVLSKIKELSTKEDNVWQVQACDALDEPQGCLWVSANCSSDLTLPQLPGVDLAQPEQGRTRCSSGVHTFWIKPLRRPGTSELGGFRLTISSSLKLPSATYNFLWMMPYWGLCRTLRPIMVNFQTQFKALTAGPRSDDADALRDRIADPRLSKLYEAVRAHLADVKADAEEMKPELLAAADTAAAAKVASPPPLPAPASPPPAVDATPAPALVGAPSSQEPSPASMPPQSRGGRGNLQGVHSEWDFLNENQRVKDNL